VSMAVSQLRMALGWYIAIWATWPQPGIGWRALWSELAQSATAGAWSTRSSGEDWWRWRMASYLLPTAA